MSPHALYPQSKIVAGFDDYMPTFKGLITEDGMLKLIEYVRSLGAKNGVINQATPLPVQTGEPTKGPSSKSGTQAAQSGTMGAR